MADDEEPEDDPEPDILDDEDTGTGGGSKSPTVSKTPSAGTKSDRSGSGSIAKSGTSISSPSTITEEETAESLEDKVSKSQEELSKSEDISLNGKKTSLDQLSTDRVQRGKKMYRQCHRRFREIIGKRELKNEELEKQTGDLQQRLNILECSMPAVMVWNIWRMTQGTTSVKPPCLKRVLEKQFEGPASGEIYCPSTPSRHFDCRVREVEAERKQALKRVEEARTLWAEKMATLEDRNKKLVEAKRIQQETKEKIQQLTAESQKLKDALPKEPEDGECEAGECGVIECKKKWLEKVPSNASIKTADIECLQRLQELAEKELAMKKQIADLEHREEAYMRTLQQADELWCRLEGDAASTMSALQEQLDQKVAANLRMADRICELEDVIEKLMERLSTCRGELEKYMSVTKIEALIGRDDDFAEILDKEVSACAEWKERMIGMDGDLVGVREKGLMAKAKMGDAQIEIHPEDFEADKLAAAADYLARLGSLSELDKCPEDFICDFSCNDVVLTETGLTEEEMKALQENRVSARMLMEKTGMDMEAELAKVREILQEEKVPITTEADIEFEEEELEEVEEEFVEAEDEFEEAEEEFEEGEEFIEETEELEDAVGEEEQELVFDEIVEDEGAVAEEAGDEVAEEAEDEVAEEAGDEVAEEAESEEAVPDIVKDEIEEAIAEEIAEEVEAAVAEEIVPDEEPQLVPPEDIKVEAEEVFEEEEGAIVTEIVDVATEPTAIVADENNVLVPREEMAEWKDGVDLIRSTIAQCSNCVIVKKDADELATKLAMLTGTEMTEIPEAVVQTSDEAEIPEDAAEAPEDEAEMPAEEEPPDMQKTDEIIEEEVDLEEEIEMEELVEETELEAAPIEAEDEELLPPEAIKEEPEEEEDEVISVEIEEKEGMIPVEVLSEEEVVEPQQVQEKREEEAEEEDKKREREERVEKKEELVPRKVREPEESTSEEEEIICTCEPPSPPAPVPKPIMKIQITQTEITRIETIQMITQTTEDIATQTLPAPAMLQQTHSPRITTTTKTLDVDSEMIERILTSRRPPAEQITAMSITGSSQASMTMSFPVRTREVPPPPALSRRADGVQKPGTEREIRSILYSKKSEDVEEGKCNCCLCAETTSSMFDVPKSKKETKECDPFFKFLSTLPTLKETCCQPVDKQIDIVKCTASVLKPLKKATRDQDMCTCGPPLLKGPKLQTIVKKCDQSCMAKIPKIKPERMPKKKECVRKDVDFDEHQCPCFTVVDTDVHGVQKKIYCACGDLD